MGGAEFGLRKRWEEWPKVCPGDCGRKTRPWHSSIAQFPGTVGAVNNTGICDPCKRKASGRPPRKQPTEQVTELAIRRSELAVEEGIRWRQRFEADRRRRGVPEDGYLMPGEKPAIIGKDRDDIPRPPKPKGKPGRKIIEPPKPARPQDAPHGVCDKGHALTLDGRGAKRCKPCLAAYKREWRAKRRRRGLPDQYEGKK